MRYRTLKRLIDAIDEAASADTAKNVYETYKTHRPKKQEKKAEALLISLCTKLASKLPIKVPGPKMPTGASSRVGKLGRTGTIGGPIVPPAVKPGALSNTGVGGVMNPRRSPLAAITANTAMPVPR